MKQTLLHYILGMTNTAETTQKLTNLLNEQIPFSDLSVLLLQGPTVLDVAPQLQPFLMMNTKIGSLLDLAAGLGATHQTERTTNNAESLAFALQIIKSIPECCTQIQANIINIQIEILDAANKGLTEVCVPILAFTEKNASRPNTVPKLNNTLANNYADILCGDLVAGKHAVPQIKVTAVKKKVTPEISNGNDPTWMLKINFQQIEPKAE